MKAPARNAAKRGLASSYVSSSKAYRLYPHRCKGNRMLKIRLIAATILVATITYVLPTVAMAGNTL